MTESIEEKSHKGLVLAAGLSSRLRPHTEDLPKSLLTVGKYPILQHAIHSFQAAGIFDYRIVTGYKAEKIENTNFPTIYNPHYREDNILGSFFHGSAQWQNGAITCYSDILFDHRILVDLIDAEGDIVVVVDPDWQDHYVGRENHPISEAELVQTNNAGDVREMGKGMATGSTAGEFLGMFKISESAGPKVYEHINRLMADANRAKDWRNSYITRYLTLLAQEGWEIKILECKHAWHEVDTYEDYLRIPNFFIERRF